MASVMNIKGNLPITSVMKERALDVRALGREDIEAWSSLLAVAFNRTAMDMAALLDWMMLGWGLIGYGVWDGDRLAAQYSCLRTGLSVPGLSQPIKVGMSVNMATHPDYRGRGLIKHAAMPVYEALKVAGALAGVGFSNAAGVKVDRHSKGYGYRVVGQLHPLIALSGLRRKLSSDFYLTDDLPLLGELQTAVSSLHFDVTHAEITHRFGLHPFRRYHYGVWEQGGEVLGVVVFQKTQLFGLPTVSLLSAYSHDVTGLLSRWIGSLTPGTLVHLLATPNSSVMQCLTRLKVCISQPWQKSPYYLTVKPLSEQTPPTLMDFDEWDCMGGNIL